MSNADLILKLNGETLTRLILRYNKLLNYGAPAPVLTTELKMILKFLCKAVDATNCYPDPDGDTHKDFIKVDRVREYSSFVEEYFQDSDESQLNELKHSTYRQLGLESAREAIELLENEAVEDALYEQGKIVDFESHRINKSIKGNLEEWIYED